MKIPENIALASGRALTAYELWYGRNEPPPQRTALRAGPLTAFLEGADLRDLRFGGVELCAGCILPCAMRTGTPFPPIWRTSPSALMQTASWFRSTLSIAIEILTFAGMRRFKATRAETSLTP